MSARHDAAGNTIHAAEVEPMHIVLWRVHGSIGFACASIMVLDAYGDVVDDVPPVDAGSGVSDLTEEDDNWSLSKTLLSKNAEVHGGPPVDFPAIQTRCRELNISLPDKTGDVFWLV